VAAQHVLLVLDRVRVRRHAAARLHRETAHGEVGTLIRSDKDLELSVLACLHDL
jgi:hypothetical protein